MATASTSQGNEWRFAGPINLNHNSQNPVSCVKFDPNEELLWIGTSTGKVSAFLPSNHFSRYSAFVVSNIYGVNSLEPTENSIFTLSDNMLRATTRQGIPVGKFTSPSMTKMMASCHLPGTSTFILGGRQSKLIHYDFVKEKEIRTADMKENAAMIIRYNGSCTFTADDSGFVNVKNSKNCETIHSIQCHGERILDFDVQGNKMITCGVSASFMDFSRKNSDTFMKIFDLRMYKALPPIGVPTPPIACRFMPSYCERVCIVHQTAGGNNMPNDWMFTTSGVRMFDLNSNGNVSSFPFESAPITAVDFSSTKHFLALGSVMGFANVFADRDHSIVNENSKETIFAAPPAEPPISFAIDDTSQTFGSIPLAFPTEPLVSDWPTELTAIVARRRKPVGDQVHQKTIHYATHIKNPRINSKLRLHNIVPYFLEHEEPLIEKSSDSISLENEQEVVLEKTKVSKLYKRRPPPVSQVPNRRANQDDSVETYSWNLIRHVTMQSTYSMNLLANCLVQIVYSLSPLRQIVLRHICEQDSCITCELHFLFTAFSSKIGNGIVTTSLAWALARNGVSLKTGGVLAGIDQIVKKTMKDLEEKDSTSSISSKLDRHLRCVRCQALQPIEPDNQQLITLNYSAIQQASLCQLIEKSLHLGRGSIDMQGEKECQECRQICRMECKRKVRELSPLLLIDTNASSEGFVDFWRRQLSNFEQRPSSNKLAALGIVPESPSDKKICRFGIECRNIKTCKYGHGKIDWASEQSKLLDDIDSDAWKHYVPSRIAVQLCEGIVRLSDISNLPDYDEPSAVIYELDAMVDVIGNGEHSAHWTHPVTLLRESPVASTAWTLINEQLVSRLHDHEARHLDGRWKLPAFLAYQKKGFEPNMSNGHKVPDELFFAEQNLANNSTQSIAIKEMEELPQKGELVGLDAEFIKIKTDLLEFNGRPVMMRAVGRASCVDSQGEKIIFDDHVKLFDDVEVVDYLTKFSGIVETDLSATSSDKYLTSHKRLLLRMHVLIQRGVIFVGHALHNDFTVLNVHVAEPQIIDTVVLMRLDSQRMLSLQFLARELLGEIIQSAAHDSVVDARYALKVYRKYLEINEKGYLAAEMRRIYSILPCPSPNNSASPLVVSINLKTPDEAEPAPKSV